MDEQWLRYEYERNERAARNQKEADERAARF